jgi:hypothetical protein
MFIEVIKKLYRRWFEKYPTAPLLYVCSHNGVTGVVRAEDFDKEVRKARAIFNKSHWPDRGSWYWDIRPIRPQVHPVFLFTNHKDKNDSVVVGDLELMAEILKGCRLEERSFELPHHKSGDTFTNYQRVQHTVDRHRGQTIGETRAHLLRDWKFVDEREDRQVDAYY